MRVISGIAKGKKLKTLKGGNVRPTTDKVKESLFNILQGNIEGADILDLYAGSGALGIEGLSRGACSAYFVDNNSKAMHLIEENLKYVNLFEKAVVYRAKVIYAIDNFANQKKKFDIIFMDPPYAEYTEKDLEIILNSDILNENGIIVLEHSSKIDISKDIKNKLKCFYQKKYGYSTLTFYRAEDRGLKTEDRG